MSKVRIEDKKSALPPECASNVVSKNEIKYPPNGESIAYKTKKSSTLKKRNWAFIVYPESAPADWKERLQAKGLQCAISPLHDKDLNPDNTLKKPHWHVIAVYAGPTSFNIVQKITEELNSPNPQPLEQIKGYYRYLSHKDNPEKHQYDEKEIQTLNGFSIFDFSEIAKGEALEIKRIICRYIRENEILTYSKMFDILDAEEKTAELDVFSNNTMFFKEYIKGVWQAKGCSSNGKKTDLNSLTDQALAEH